MITDWPIQEIARLAHTTSRTLRHYGDLGLLPTSRVDAWWRSMSSAEKTAWRASMQTFGADWQVAAASGLDPAGEEAQALAQRQFDWLRGIHGTPGGVRVGRPGCTLWGSPSCTWRMSGSR